MHLISDSYIEGTNASIEMAVRKEIPQYNEVLISFGQSTTCGSPSQNVLSQDFINFIKNVNIRLPFASVIVNKTSSSGLANIFVNNADFTSTF